MLTHFFITSFSLFCYSTNDSDPKTNPNAKKFETLTFEDMIRKDLKVIDTAAMALCKNNKIPLIVFDFASKDSVKNILLGQTIGTYVGE
jgi:uridylate kinase